jgi:hypothetical protein
LRIFIAVEKGVIRWYYTEDSLYKDVLNSGVVVGRVDLPGFTAWTYFYRDNYPSSSLSAIKAVIDRSILRLSKATTQLYTSIIISRHAQHSHTIPEAAHVASIPVIEKCGGGVGGVAPLVSVRVVNTWRYDLNFPGYPLLGLGRDRLIVDKGMWCGRRVYATS